MSGKQIVIRTAVRVYGKGFKVGKEGSAALKEYLGTLTPDQKRNAVAHLTDTGAVEGLDSLDEREGDQPIADATQLATAAGEVKDKEQGQGNADKSIPSELAPAAPATPAETEEKTGDDKSASGKGKRGG